MAERRAVVRPWVMLDNMAVRPTGLWIPIVTPFTSAGGLDEKALRQLAERLLADGVDGLVALGTTGEPATMSAQERRRVVEICDAACHQAKRPLMVGAGTNSTAGTIEEVELLTANTTSVAGALIVVPYYTRPSEQAVVDHFHLVADASLVPLIVYNIPYRTGRGLGAAALSETAAHPNVVGLKQAVGGLDSDTLSLLADRELGMSVLAGDDAFITPSILMGGAGAIAAAAHVCTALFVEMVAAACSGLTSRAVELAGALLPVVTAGFAEPSPAVWKGALAHGGAISSAHVRRPLTPASPDAVTALLDAVATLNR